MTSANIVRPYDYDDVPTVRLFSYSKAYRRGIMGPIGSGKSSGCLMELLRMAQLQQPSSDGIRRTKWGIVRNTYGDLVKTTMETFYKWVPPHMLTDYMKINKNDMRIVISDISQKTGKGTFYSEFLFLSADSPSQVEGWRSLELTGAYLNEAPLLTKEAFEMIESRCGRFPDIERDPITGELTNGPTWSGVIFDANPPDTDSWFYKMFEEMEYPDNLDIECNGCRKSFLVKENDGRCPECGTKFQELFKQPSGLSPEAENIRWLKGGRSYYTMKMIGHDPEWIKSNVHGEYANISTGKPVYHNFSHNNHVYDGKEPLLPLRNLPLVVGIDLYGTCSAAITQLSPHGRMTIFREIVTQSYTPDFIVQFLTPILQKEFRGFEIILVIDPTGKDKGNNGISSQSLYQKAGFRTEIAPSNDPMIRVGAVDYFLIQRAGQGMAFLVDKSCQTIIKGMSGKYIIGNDNKPKKDGDAGAWSHIQDAVQYAALWHRNFQYQPKKSNIFIPPNFSGGGVRSGAY